MGGVHLNADEVGFGARKALEALADHVARDPSSLERLRDLERGLDLLTEMEFGVDLWGAQNTFYRVLRTSYPDQRQRADAGDEDARRWTRRFRRVGRKLSVAVA